MNPNNILKDFLGDVKANITVEVDNNSITKLAVALLIVLLIALLVYALIKKYA